MVLYDCCLLLPFQQKENLTHTLDRSLCTRTHNKVLRDTYAEDTLTHTCTHCKCARGKKGPMTLDSGRNVRMCGFFSVAFSTGNTFGFLLRVCERERANQIFVGFVSLVDISYKFYTEYCLGSLQVIYLSFGSSFAEVLCCCCFFRRFAVLGKSPGKKFSDVIFVSLVLCICVLV